MGTLIDLAGATFGSWTVLREDGRDKHGQAYWTTVCVCGKQGRVPGGRLRRGESTSCGCGKGAKCAAANVTHGHSARGHMTPEYRAWQLIIDRCERETNKSYRDYGERGIAIAPEWRNDYLAFLAHIGPRPSSLHSVDRKENDLGYQPGNVRWATRAQQNVNKRNNRFLEFDGRRQTLSQWARETGICDSTISVRLSKGLSVAEALTLPVRTTVGSRRKAA